MTPDEIKRLQEENAKLKKENVRYKKEVNKAKENTAKAVEAVTAAAKSGSAIIVPDLTPIEGTIKVKFTKPNGEKVAGEYGFAPGNRAVRLKNGAVVSSEAIIKLASLKKDEVLTDEELKASPALAKMTKEDATNFLTDLVKIGSTVLIEIED